MASADRSTFLEAVVISSVSLSRAPDIVTQLQRHWSASRLYSMCEGEEGTEEPASSTLRPCHAGPGVGVKWGQPLGYYQAYLYTTRAA